MTVIVSSLVALTLGSLWGNFFIHSKFIQSVKNVSDYIFLLKLFTQYVPFIVLLNKTKSIFKFKIISHIFNNHIQC